MDNTNRGVLVEPSSSVVRFVLVSDDDDCTGGGCGRSDGNDDDDDGGVEKMKRTGAGVGVLVAATGGGTVTESNRVGDTEGVIVVGAVCGGPGVIKIISACTADADSKNNSNNTDNNCRRRRLSGIG
jgi:hypothetical protein